MKPDASASQPLRTTALMREVLSLIDRPATDMPSYKRLPGKLGIRDLTVSIVLLREVAEVVRELPSKCFPNEEVKMNIRDAILGALDELIVEEEERDAQQAPTPEAR
ncbi:MAG: TyeA family type III secretion system gatekeeper subunit [Hydrogenophaga sp.]|uniref:TyeA family type III secretion system gatekeeper subunit n=1 Tax=Hydrogenophaga sp. TaxID=1904254 RepID=UPI0016BA5858|nr:TyeA family type III secretion system gatekeeper subunit [Hydrogenophaga sp.]NIM39591.1 TyeA family type III secretion system gatekeeper subunit [Hydrogenophaga sp.]NIN24795.1 TyeA family type III secretion system gatekeeper subunit [Hydrogenophaga sp.]NIN29307.1 TyeA family type III secretion system gatekeeper subunit [Hydrogenophaga sp.]NIN53830.1 TyeA family type III secretion system gatekeeper subunit [Hydrogenophaga sp.]NIO50034.1 TyeA family type III secretion system gatekeeper subuni